MENNQKKTLMQRILVPFVSGAIMLGALQYPIVSSIDSRKDNLVVQSDLADSFSETSDELIKDVERKIYLENELKFGKKYKTPETPEEFIDSVKDYARSTHQESGIPSSVIIAQAALETGWGKSVPGYNFFGIKSPRKNKKSGKCLRTHEYENGKMVIRDDFFREYFRVEDCFKDYSKVIASSFGSAMKYKHNPLKFVRALHQAGYATDPQYSSTLAKIIKQYDLTKYDIPFIAYNQQQ